MMKESNFVKDYNLNSIFTRRSIRQFTDQIVEKEKIDSLIRAAMQAPSANNQQAWHFLVVEGKENLEKLSELHRYSKCLKGASLAIVVLGNTSIMTSPDFWQQDLGAATQNIQLQAVELGLGSVWLGTAPKEERIKFIQDLFNIDKNLVPYSVLAIGYPKGVNKFVDRFDETKVTYIN